ncbi:MAG: CC/Se motif family (seleno)protein [Halanaerobiaceae bacterium]
MNIQIDEKAYDYIINNGGEVYIYTNSIRGCCGGQTAVNMEPQLELGSPVSAEIGDYEEYNYQQIKIYIHKNIDQEMLSGKTIVLKKALGIFRKLMLQR